MSDKTRLVFAFNQEEYVTQPDIQVALDVWNFINKDPRKWATFETEQYAHERVVRVDWGYVHSNEQKERALETITYRMSTDGFVVVSHAVHA